MKKFVMYNPKNNLYVSSLFFLHYSDRAIPELNFSSLENSIIFNESFFEESLPQYEGIEGKKELLLAHYPYITFKEVEFKLK